MPRFSHTSMAKRVLPPLTYREPIRVLAAIQGSVGEVRELLNQDHIARFNQVLDFSLPEDAVCVLAWLARAIVNCFSAVSKYLQYLSLSFPPDTGSLKSVVRELPGWDWWWWWWWGCVTYSEMVAPFWASTRVWFCIGTSAS